MKKVIIIGGGAAGLMAAALLCESGIYPTVIEKNKILGQKLRITGKGRCNVTNQSGVRELVENTVTNGRFLYGAFSAFSAEDTMLFFESHGVPLKTERGNRVFPVSDKAADIAGALIRTAEKAHFVRAQAQQIVVQDCRVTGVKTTDGKTYPCDAVILATGGASYPKTGSTGDGYRMAEALGHTVVPPKPSLVPLVSPDIWVHALSGISLKNVAVTFEKDNKKLYDDFGEMLFTHFGVSGPVILSASAHLKGKCPLTLLIDTKPALSEEKVDLRLQRELAVSPKRQMATVMKTLLPAAMAAPVLRLAGIREDERSCDIAHDRRRALGVALKAIPVSIDGFRPIEEAIITSGGVEVKEIQPKTMASKKAEGLYLIGELLDVDAYTGGFNLQIAFSTAAAAARALTER